MNQAIFVCAPFDSSLWNKVYNELKDVQDIFPVKAIFAFHETISAFSKPARLPSLTRVAIFVISSMDYLNKQDVVTLNTNEKNVQEIGKVSRRSIIEFQQMTYFQYGRRFRTLNKSFTQLLWLLPY